MALDDDIALLTSVPLLGGIDREALRLLAFSAETRQLRAGDILFRKGDASDGGYVVARGAVALIEEEGREAVLVIGPAGLIGEVALISETKRPVTAVAREPTQVLRISRAMFRRTLDEYPAVAERLRRDFARRVRDARGALAEVQKGLTRE